MTTPEDDRYLTRREADILIAANDARHADRFDAHEKVHRAEQVAVQTALNSVDRERNIHTAAHIKEHDSHQREHTLNGLAIDKSESSNDKRFEAVNGSRQQMNDALRLLASRDTVDRMIADADARWENMRKELDRRFTDAAKLTQERYESNRASIIALEKGDVKQEGRGLGQGATIAAIIGTVSFVATILGIIIIVANITTAGG